MLGRGRQTVATSLSRSGRRYLSTSEAAGIKVASIDSYSPISELSLVVKGGSRYESVPGVAHLLEKFAFKHTKYRSSLRLIRESELLGGQLSTSLGRENLVLTAKFLKEDLPFFVEALFQVADGTIYNQYELAEEAAPIAALDYKAAKADNLFTALDLAHGVAFRRGLGNPLLASPFDPVSVDDIKSYGQSVYTKSNVSLVAKGVIPGDLEALVADTFASLSAGTGVSSEPSAFYGGEVRVKASGDSTSAVIAFPTKPSPALDVLSKILGGSSSVKWNVGSSPLSIASEKSGASIVAKNFTYSDASLFTVSVSSSDASAVKAGITEAIAAVKKLAGGVSSEQLSRAVAQAKFDNITALETNPLATLSGSVDLANIKATAVKSAAESLLKGGKVAYATVGKVNELPYADELL